MADYTTLAAVKRALGSSENADDTLLAELITQASRTIDRYCAGHVEASNYFVRETLSNVLLHGVISNGSLLCWPRKPIVESVSELAYRLNPRNNWNNLDPAQAMIAGYTVRWAGIDGQGYAQVKISFIGGFNSLPDDLVNAATLLVVRFYKEVKSGLTDSIGVAELGTLQYTKALPERLRVQLRPYHRIV